MFDKFGEMDTFGEINELAENLFNEGDTASIKTMAKENGIDKEYVEMYLSGDIPVLCDAMTAALGKIDVEVADLKPKEIMEDWVEYLRGQCADRARKKGFRDILAGKGRMDETENKDGQLLWESDMGRKTSHMGAGEKRKYPPEHRGSGKDKEVL